MYKLNILFILLFIIIILIFNKNNIDTFTVKKANKIIYCFWTGDNEMSKNRKICLKSIINNSGVPVKFITKKNLNKYILKEEPLHKGYNYLSNVHKADYLRTYFMHFYGGGYTDIKMINYDWNKYFDKLNNSNKLAIGYKEIYGGSSTNLDTNKLIGNGCYIFKPRTKITSEWYESMINTMNNNFKELQKYPANDFRDFKGKKLSNNRISKYPLAWAQLLCDNFHPVVYKYNYQILNSMPLINTNNYL